MLLAKTLGSTVLRLALIYVGVFSAAIFGLLGYVGWSTADYLRARSVRAITRESTRLEESFDRGGRTALIALINRQIVEKPIPDVVYLLTDPAYAVIAGNARRWPAALADGSGEGEFPASDAVADGRPHHMFGAVYRTLSDGSHLMVARDITEVDDFVTLIDRALGAGAVLMLIFAAAAGITITRRTVGRIEAVNATCREIMRSGLGRRIPTRGTKDEWDQLADNLNSMLDRIEELIGEVKHITDNVAHDLRTPLTRMRGRLERAFERGLDSERDQALVGDTIQDLDRVLATFSSLLRISQIEAQGRRTAFRPVDLTEIAGQVVELFDAAAEEQGGSIRFASSGKLPVLGDKDLLFEALANLVDNALKHGGQGAVTVELAQEGDSAVVAVADRGPGIPPEERKHVFKRFYRLERSRSSPGNGLGLSLVAAVAQLHEARVELDDNAPGLILRLRFPLLPDQVPASAKPALAPAS